MLPLLGREQTLILVPDVLAQELPHQPGPKGSRTYLRVLPAPLAQLLQMLLHDRAHPRAQERPFSMSRKLRVAGVGDLVDEGRHGLLKLIVVPPDRGMTDEQAHAGELAFRWEWGRFLVRDVERGDRGEVW